MNWSTQTLTDIKNHITQQAQELGFQDMRVADTQTSGYFERYQQWIAENHHGDMSFLARNLNLRAAPTELLPGTVRVLSFRYDYLPTDAKFTFPLLNPEIANISRYALGRDYHKLMRKKLALLVSNLQTFFNLESSLECRVFVDSAPVMESSFAEKSGIGWKGKHTLVINKQAGSWFFLGEIFINIPLVIDPPVEANCGKCTACINLCPTNAILEDSKIDARRCISYLTIENQGAIPLELRDKIGNRIYGCDDCQLACPWNRFAETSLEKDFQARNQLDQIPLLTLWKWSETDFLNLLQGSPIRRIGYQNWLRNLAVAIGNSHYSKETIEMLQQKKPEANEIVLEHIDWAIKQLNNRTNHPKAGINVKTLKLINCVNTMLPRDA